MKFLFLFSELSLLKEFKKKEKFQLRIKKKKL